MSDLPHEVNLKVCALHKPFQKAVEIIAKQTLENTKQIRYLHYKTAVITAIFVKLLSYIS